MEEIRKYGDVLSCVISLNLYVRLIAALLSDKMRASEKFDLIGCSLDQIAAVAGMNVKTVKNVIKNAQPVLA